MSLFTPTLLPPILRLRSVLRLPLQITRIVSPAPLERHDVVNDVARAGTRGLPRRGAWMVALEVPLGNFAPLDVPVAVPSDTNCPRRRGVQ